MKSRQKGKKKGSSKERVFGCDLREHLQHSGQEVPQVLRSCAEFVQEYGVVDGIYRLSGVSSNIQKLRSLRRSGSQTCAGMFISRTFTASLPCARPTSENSQIPSSLIGSMTSLLRQWPCS